MMNEDNIVKGSSPITRAYVCWNERESEWCIHVLAMQSLHSFCFVLTAADGVSTVPSNYYVISLEYASSIISSQHLFNFLNIMLVTATSN